MDKNTLFELIRKEEVVLWAGAGLSMYAGYPSGKELTDILLKSLPDAYRQELDVSKPLPQFVEDYVKLQRGNINGLIKTLNKVYSKNPKSIRTHQVIASVPHIKSIITTNYDSLFEQAYGDRLHKVVTSLNLMYLDKEKATLFKVHGDLQDADSILISARDYRDFFVEKKGQILWKYIENMLATKTVVFFGYSLDDVNVLSMYEQLKKEFKGHLSQAYFVAPSISRLKQLELEENNIIYIPQTGEQFFDELLQNIKDNILYDVEVGYTSADTFKRFMAFHELKANLSNVDSGYEVSKLTKTNGQASAKLKLKFDENRELMDKFLKIMNGVSHEPLTLSMSDLKDADVRIEDLKLPLNGSREYRLVLSPQPVHEALYDLFFDDFEIHKLSVKVFKVAHGLKITAALHTSNITVDVTFVDNEIISQLTIENAVSDEDCPASSTKEQIEIYEFMSNLSSGRPFKYFSHATGASGKMSPIEASATYASQYAMYFRKLQVIERSFDVRFSYFKDINAVAEEVSIIYKALTGAVEEVKWEGYIPMEQLSDYGDKLQKEIDEKGDIDLAISEINPSELTIHGKEIKLNIVRNFKFVTPKIMQSPKGDGLCLKSENDLYIVTYSQAPYSKV